MLGRGARGRRFEANVRRLPAPYRDDPLLLEGVLAPVRTEVAEHHADLSARHAFARELARRSSAQVRDPILGPPVRVGGLEAKQSKRDEWELLDEGRGIRWPSVDEDISVAGLLRGGRNTSKRAI